MKYCSKFKDQQNALGFMVGNLVFPYLRDAEKYCDAMDLDPDARVTRDIDAIRTNAQSLLPELNYQLYVLECEISKVREQTTLQAKIRDDNRNAQNHDIMNTVNAEIAQERVLEYMGRVFGLSDARDRLFERVCALEKILRYTREDARSKCQVKTQSEARKSYTNAEEAGAGG